MSTIHIRESRRRFIQLSAIAAAGIAVGALSRAGQAPNHSANAAAIASPNATATREAEIDELNYLRTQVANQPVCSPMATETSVLPTPSPTEAPISLMGNPVPYAGIWTITVLGITPTPAVTVAPPTGKYMQVNLSASHAQRTSQILRLTDFLLRDSMDRFSVPSAGTNREIFGNLWMASVDPGVSMNAAIVFDVAADAGDSFILESNADPTFRVAMTVEQRG